MMEYIIIGAIIAYWANYFAMIWFRILNSDSTLLLGAMGIIITIGGSAWINYLMELGG